MNKDAQRVGERDVQPASPAASWAKRAAEEHEAYIRMLKNGPSAEGHGEAIILRHAPATLPSGRGEKRVWLWKNGDHYLAYDSLYPKRANGDPAVLGEPTCSAILSAPLPKREVGPHFTDAVAAAERIRDNCQAAYAHRVSSISTLKDANEILDCLNAYVNATLPPSADGAADKERLDWLGAQRKLWVYLHATGEVKLRTTDEFDGRITPPTYSTIRAAIDSAMRSTPAGEEGPDESSDAVTGGGDK